MANALRHCVADVDVVARLATVGDHSIAVPSVENVPQLIPNLQCSCRPFPNFMLNIM